jgi:hypothetical protein
MINGWADISKAAKPLSTNLRAQTTTPFPKVKNKNPAIVVFLSCLQLMAILLPKSFAIRNIKIPATIKRIDASINGGSSFTAILFNKYVDPQITYIEKNARIISNELWDLGMKNQCDHLLNKKVKISFLLRD